MSLCGLSATHDASPSIGSAIVRSSPRRLDRPNGKAGSGSGRGIHTQSAMIGKGQTHRPSHTNATTNPSRQSHHVPSGMKSIGAKATKTTNDGKSEVPFAPRPMGTLQRSAFAQNPTIPHSSSRITQPNSTTANKQGRSTLPSRSFSRKVIPSKPLAMASTKAIEISPTVPRPTEDREPAMKANGLTIALPVSGSQTLSSISRTTRTEPKKRPLPPVVMEISKMVMPKDFLAGKGGEDLYARLPELWAKSGNADDTLVSWTNPDAPSSWELVRMYPRVAPAIPPPPSSPGSTTSESSTSSPSATPQHAGAVARRNRSRGPSMVSEVYADSRYIGVAPKKAKLMQQSSKTQNKLGPLDHAQFRDYRLLPIDYFVAPMEGFQVQAAEAQAIQAALEAEENKEESAEEPQEGRPRRSRRQPAPRQILSPHAPPPKEKKKKRQLTKTGSFIGKNHQVDALPRPSNLYRVDRNMYQDSTYVSNKHRDEQMWDPQKAEAAKRRGEDIDGFLSPARELNSQMLLLQALHQADYCVKKAEDKFVDLYRASKEPSTEMSEEEKAKADAMFETSRKDFGAIATALNRSVASVLAQYYYWKSMEKKQGKGGYMRLKNTWKNEEDLCTICDDGGILIVCDHCHRAFHMECLNPPLKEAPKTNWYCSDCLKSPAKLRRIPSTSPGTPQALGIKADLPEEAEDTKPAAARALPFGAQGGPPQLPIPQLPVLEREQQNGNRSRAAEMVIDLTED